LSEQWEKEKWKKRREGAEPEGWVEFFPPGKEERRRDEKRRQKRNETREEKTEKKREERREEKREERRRREERKGNGFKQV
jgi:hypothetical protein